MKFRERLYAKAAPGLALAAAAACLLTPAASMAQVSGPWRVSGDIDGKNFVLDCQFVPNGTQLGGVCTDVATGDSKKSKLKKHKLSSGSVKGSAVAWSYPVKVMFLSVDINFAGTLNGNRMTGTISAKGREGHFTASQS
ncbi:hypothetical protein [Novosphingobium beihaiensis]|uniref:Protease inhibitor Inh n=1 Tax=Novosphingobium beihaiensis TaxID=2930389 RepID=A0ABT0BUK8_9SPHN|nr:hypothetical protein [Novosphingobium beihaiensis]MCJ2188692.1 hypothetical protein [Novosphingobium beihaiensis]